MHPTHSARRRFLAGVVALAGAASGAAAQAPPPAAPVQPSNAPGALPPPEVKVDAKTGALIVPLGGVVRFDPPGGLPIKEIVNRNEDVLESRVDIKTPTSVILIGRRAGASRISLTLNSPDADLKAVYDVIVQADYDLLRNVIKRAMPTATVDIIPGAGNAIILTGSVAKPEDSDLIQRITSDAAGGSAANIINTIQVGGSQHVLIDLTIAQVDRSETRSRGFNFGVGGTTASFYSVLGGITSPGPLGAAGFNVSPSTGGTGPNLVLGIVPASFVGALRALRGEGLAKFLSEPKVVTQTGRPAFFRSGGQQAILGQASGINGPGVLLQPVGTEVEVLPIVYGNGKIYLEVAPRVTSVNNARGISTAFGFSTGFNEQSTRTSVMLESGQTFAIGGLIENQVQATAERVPYLGDLPLVGTVFSNTTHSEQETELVVLVTPRLVEAMDCSQVPRRVPGKEARSPDDYEFFLETLLEAPRGQRKPWGPNGYNAAYKCDPTYGKYPCIGGVCAGGTAGQACGPTGCSLPGTGATMSSPVMPVGGFMPDASAVRPAHRELTLPAPGAMAPAAPQP
ncbi:MAG: type II and III secretion system protein family protein [Fimbriiglobus sp.]